MKGSFDFKVCNSKIPDYDHSLAGYWGAVHSAGVVYFTRLSYGVKDFLRADLDHTIFPYDCSMQLAHVMSTTQIVSSKSEVQHLHDSCTQHKKCGRILKRVLKPYNSCSHNQNVRITNCIRYLLDMSSALHRSHIGQS